MKNKRLEEKDLSGFLKMAQSVVTEASAKLRGARLPVPTLSIAPGGRKYFKIVRDEDGGYSGASVHAFIERSNGDILMAAGWATPAKHARGNIFDADGGKAAMTPYGVVYLRG